MGIDEVGIDKVGIDKVGITPHNILDHPSNQEASPQGKTLCAVSITCVLPRETTTLHTLYLQLINAGQRREDVIT